MIVKIQLPLMTNEKVPQALIYSESREVDILTDAVDFREVMGDRKKAFFHAELNADGAIEIGEEAGWQEW